MIAYLILTFFLAYLTFLIYLIVKGNAVDDRENKEYSKFIDSLNGQNLFIYTNKEKSKKFIENEILPHISDSSIIFLKGKTIISDFNKTNISKLLSGIDEKGGFPYIIKVREDTIYENSINNKVFNAITQGKKLTEIIHLINEYYNSLSI